MVARGAVPHERLHDPLHGAGESWRERKKEREKKREEKKRKKERKRKSKTHSLSFPSPPNSFSKQKQNIRNQKQRAREGGPGNDLVPEAWKETKCRENKETKEKKDSASSSSFPSWTPAVGLAATSIGILSILWALFARPELAAELGNGLLGSSSDDGASGGSLAGRWAWAAQALSTNRATWAFALDATLYSVWQAAILREAAPLERFFPFFGMAAYLMRVRTEGGEGEEEA